MFSLIQNVSIQEPFFNEMESHFLCPLYAFSHAGVGANHLIIPVNTTHVLVVVVYKLELSDDITMSVMLSGIDDICLVDCGKEMDFLFVIETSSEHVFMSSNLCSPFGRLGVVNVAGSLSRFFLAVPQAAVSCSDR